MLLNVKNECIDDVISIIKNADVKDYLIHNKWWLNTRDKFNIDLDELDLDDLISLRDYFRSKRAKIFVRKLNNIIEILENPDENLITDLESFCIVLKETIYDKSKHKWVFCYKDEYGFFVPYFVSNIYYESPKKDQYGYLIEDYVAMELHTNEQNGFKKSIINFYKSDIVNKNVLECLLDKNFYIETEELYDEYSKNDLIFKDRLKENCKQYKCKSYWEINSWGTSNTKISESDDIISFYKVINDSKKDSRNFVTYDSSHIWDFLDKKYNKAITSKYMVPTVPFIRCFNLDTNHDAYCHISEISDYVYDHTLKEKLVLPKTHKNLLDILVNKQDILKGDIIENKGNGTVIILEGPPGCGKTLTTEVYSEIVEKPLYKVSTGQLGINPDSIEQNLREVLGRAQRLNCILLIDECETFVRKRGLDLNQNAIVTTFLRTIEYFDGIMFLTSNRIKDIDDAILSRCAAAIKYEVPNKENAKKIWKVLIDQFELKDKISEKTINQAVEAFPSAVGRDIKELIKLTARYCNGNNISIDIEALISCAQFRYIEINENFIIK